MDIDLTLNSQRSQRQRYKIIWTLVIVCFVLFLYGLKQWLSPMSLLASSVQIAQVQQIDFAVKIRGFGRLKAKQQRFLTNSHMATVEAIHVYPGTRVSKETVIVSLVNPEQTQRLSVARLELARQKAVYNEQIINQKSQLLERESTLTLLQSELENAQLRAEAESKLIEQGIVSSLDYKRSLLHVKQLNQRVAIEQQRSLQLQEMHRERIKVQQELLRQFELNYIMQNKRLSSYMLKRGSMACCKS